jgi:hypothetical protein
MPGSQTLDGRCVEGSAESFLGRKGVSQVAPLGPGVKLVSGSAGRTRRPASAPY